MCSLSTSVSSIAAEMMGWADHQVSRQLWLILIRDLEESFISIEMNQALNALLLIKGDAFPKDEHRGNISGIKLLKKGVNI